ncbi:hypothetical protein P43SY_003240 [Pythium insidiosum]|uniref:Asparagine synthetase domain-containing protein n=1 Tax=Pythium insidiosum TaxID=114742 RepID=A0AAD5LB45_PYTIN|nr:hypothetical protein P43SY_003240 [Pythium insidiosum]
MAPPTAKHVLTRLRQSLAANGIDVFIPLTLERYNEYLANDTSTTTDLLPYQLPLVSPSLSSHLVVLIGNSRAMWEPFLRHAALEVNSNGRLLPDPVDRYVRQSVERAVDELEQHGIERPAQTYWVSFDSRPGKMILAQKMAVASGKLSRCPVSMLCIHPVLGPWLAFRCALVFSIEGLSDDDVEANGEDDPLSLSKFPDQPEDCGHDDEMHKLLEAQTADAMAQVQADQPMSFTPNAWKKWAMPRITMAPSHPFMYTSDQIMYHYAKDTEFLTKVVHAHKHNLCKDYLRDPVPSAVLQCRRLVQQVLRDIRDQYPDGIDAIALSGGLDTSIIAEASDQDWATEDGIGALSLDKRGHGRPILRFRDAFTVQAHSDARDAGFAAEICSRLGDVFATEHCVIRSSLDDLVKNATTVAKLLATCDPMELRNSLVIYKMMSEAATRGVRHIVTGDGADELFCGYSFFHKLEADVMAQYRDQICKVMRFTAPKLGAAFGIQVLSPFLDPRIVAFARTLHKDDVVGPRTPVPLDGPHAMHGKLVLRQAFPESWSQWRLKEPIESGAGTTALRLGFFDSRWSDAEFEDAQRRYWRQHGLVVRDREHLFFVEVFLEAFDGDLKRVPRERRRTGDEKTPLDAGFCPACGFALSHVDQDFCVTCGFWPTRVTSTNDRQGYATAALTTLAETQHEGTLESQERVSLVSAVDGLVAHNSELKDAIESSHARQAA